MAKQIGFRYPVTEIRVVDSDTLEAWVRVSTRTRELWRIRLSGIEGGELPTPEGLRGKLILEKIIAARRDRFCHFIGLETILDKYGRHVGDIMFPPDELLTVVMFRGGHFWHRKRTGQEFGGPYSQPI
jgi:endonuclease YncB( thermonuclease family)